MKSTRRKFIQHSAIAGAGLAINPLPFFTQGSPNKKIVVAVMGVRSRGRALADNLAQQPHTEVAYICDVDQRYLNACVDSVAKLQNKKPKGEKDIRKILEDKNVDAAVMATPDHWHAPGALMAVKAGKHVYLEKPCSHNPREGELLIAAEKKYKRLIHMGNQRRSWPKVVECMQALQGGMIGKVYMAKGWYANARKPIGFGKEAPVPDYLDWDLWQGPAPRIPYRDNIHPYEWHWFWHWGTGEALNNGAHEIDVARWGMGVNFPNRVVASGGRYHYNDDWEFPDTMVVNFEFEDGRLLTWESRSCNPYLIENDGRGNIFHGTEGTCVVIGNGYRVYDLDNKLVKEVKHERGALASSTDTTSPDANLDGVHIKNFLDSIRNGTPNSSPIEEGHKSVLMCQLANIAWKTGRVLHIDQRNGHIIGDNDAMKLWGRSYEPGWEMVV
jgi:predicted dehydrogenase